VNFQVASAFSIRVQFHSLVQVFGVPCVEAAVVALNDVDVVGHPAELERHHFFRFFMWGFNVYECRTIVRKNLLNINIPYSLDGQRLEQP